jgi:tetraacyldisaccharide 4'-kinase
VREPRFWWLEPGLVAAALAPVAAIYGAITASRMRGQGKRAALPVGCVGNFTLGGSGKTPTVIALAQMLTAAGRKPVLLSRGYRGDLAGPIQVDPQHHGAADVGDEPLLLARAAPTVVSADRVAGAALAAEAGAGIVVKDDGFPNPSLAKDVSILEVDARRGVGNGRVLPAGPLRAPLQPQLARASALLVIGDGDAADDVRRVAARGDSVLPVFRGRLTPDRAAVAALAGRPVLAFAGIGDPGKFFATLAEAGVTVSERRGFPDHHRYTRDEAADLVASDARRALTLVTTEKDFVRLKGEPSLATLAAQSVVLPVTLSLDDTAGFRQFLLGALALRR